MKVFCWPLYISSGVTGVNSKFSLSSTLRQKVWLEFDIKFHSSVRPTSNYYIFVIHDRTDANLGKNENDDYKFRTNL